MSCRNKEIRELTVLNHGSADLPLREFPIKVDVYLKDKCVPPPCNPEHHHNDFVLWRLDHDKNGWFLNLQWHVHGHNEIVCSVEYSCDPFWIRWLNGFVSIFFGD